MLKAVSRDSREARFGPGAVLRSAGEPARDVVLLLSGTVVAAHSAPSGAEVWPDLWVAPAIADKPAVLDGSRPEARLMALTAVTARLLPRTRFLTLLDQQHSVREHVLVRLAKDVLAGRHRLAQAVALPAVAQVAAWLTTRPPAGRVAWRGPAERAGNRRRRPGSARTSVGTPLTRDFCGSSDCDEGRGGRRRAKQSAAERVLTSRVYRLSIPSMIVGRGPS